jgi:hypothetical protein
VIVDRSQTERSPCYIDLFYIGVFAHDIVILLDPAEIVENIHDAYGHPLLGQSLQPADIGTSGLRESCGAAAASRGCRIGPARFIAGLVLVGTSSIATLRRFWKQRFELISR